MSIMSMSIRPWLTVLLTTLIASGARAEPVTPTVIEVFVLSNQSVSGVDAVHARGPRVQVHVVDDVSRFEAELTAMLPADTAGRQEEVGAMIHQTITPDMEDRIVRAWHALQRATLLGITQTPAVVFDGNSVVYGVADIDQALQIWQEDNG